MYLVGELLEPICLGCNKTGQAPGLVSTERAPVKEAHGSVVISSWAGSTSLLASITVASAGKTGSLACIYWPMIIYYKTV